MRSTTFGAANRNFFLIVILLLVLNDIADATNGNTQQIVSIQGGYGQNCSGVIISSHDVLTTVNCTLGPIDRLFIRSGSNLKYFGGTLHNAINVTKHERFHQEHVPVNDIAIIRVKQAFNNTAPIKLLRNQLKPYTLVFVMKWSRLGFQVELKNSTVYIVNKTRCNIDYDGDLRDGQICTISTFSVYGPCLNNAGAPLIVNGSLAGIFSFSQGCMSNKSAVYTEIAYYYDWINRHIQHISTGHPQYNPHGHYMLPNQIHHPSNSYPQLNNHYPNSTDKLNPNLKNPNSKNDKFKRNSAHTNAIVLGSTIFYIVQTVCVLITLNY